MVAPTACFLGLWRFLEWLRDDRLLVELAQREEFAGALDPSMGAAVEEDPRASRCYEPGDVRSGSETESRRRR